MDDYDQKPDAGQWVRVHYNLHIGGLSVTNTEGLVIYQCETCYLEDAEFRVSQTIRDRVVRTNRRRVHAKVHGHWVEPNEEADLDVAVRYNPYDAGAFITVEGDRPVSTASLVKIDGNRCYVARGDVEADGDPQDYEQGAD